MDWCEYHRLLAATEEVERLLELSGCRNVDADFTGLDTHACTVGLMQFLLAYYVLLLITIEHYG